MLCNLGFLLVSNAILGYYVYPKYYSLLYIVIILFMTVILSYSEISSFFILQSHIDSA